MLQPFGDRFKQLITHRMAVVVIYRLEIVEVKKEQCAMLLVLTCQLQLMGDMSVLRRTVGQAGQGIEAGQTLHPALVFLAVGNIVENMNQVADPALVVRHHADGLQSRNNTAICMAIIDFTLPGIVTPESM